MSIAENLKRVRERIAAAARKAGRSPDEIALMVVSKTFPAERIREAYDAGQRLFGENRVQEFAEKQEEVGELLGVDWHLIGHLQTNKAAKAVELFDCVESVDSLRLLQRLNSACEARAAELSVFIELNLGGEESKTGLAPESDELEAILAAAPSLKHVTIRGLMTIPPFTEDPEGARPYFRRLREIRDQITARDISGVYLVTLSMGMSHDFEIAVEEGSTCVRLGTAIFGERPKP